MICGCGQANQRKPALMIFIGDYLVQFMVLSLLESNPTNFVVCGKIEDCAKLSQSSLYLKGPPDLGSVDLAK